MIAYLRGAVLQVFADTVIILVGDVGYRVVVGGRVALEFSGKRDEVTELWIETQVSDSTIQLVGFQSHEEWEWFRLLTGVHGVGTRMALGLLSSFSPVQLRAAIVQEDSKSLQVADGVGAKLASRLIMELRDKVKKFLVMQESVQDGAVFMARRGLTENAKWAATALCRLGYSERDVNSVLERIEGRENGLATEELIRKGLQHLAKTPAIVRRDA